jgi:UTP--glucose-1-phosphate uridylyltransferase
MVKAHASVGRNMGAVVEVPRAHTNRYGILDIGRAQGPPVEICGPVEKPLPENAPPTLSVIGRYLLQPEVMQHLDRKACEAVCR